MQHVTPEPCAICSAKATCWVSPGGCHIVYCDDCYDGAPDGHATVGMSYSRDAAVRDWNANNEMDAEGGAE